MTEVVWVSPYVIIFTIIRSDEKTSGTEMVWEHINHQHHFCHDMKEYNMAEDMAQNQSVWYMKTKAGPLLHGGGL